MSKKQATLFQSWGNRAKVTEDRPVQSVPQPSTSLVNDDIIDLCGSFEDGDDDLLFEAEESLANISNKVCLEHNTHQEFLNRGSEEHSYTNKADEIHVGDISIGADGFTPTQVQTQSSTFPGFDKCAGKLWIYPTNYPVREYQFNIVQQALFKNTMVTLPTGLGKTFIAAVVMYNFYRWYPQGKVIFMAPTKPLVAQQIEACYNIMGIPQDHTAEMTGSMGPSKRERAWHDKRVFFLTPQVLTNDLSRGSCPAHDVKCLVIDEAHKALGNHAYCQVVRELVKYTENFRILALSATPGSDIKAVQQVLNNLLISQIEIRTEESADIKRYSHERKVEKVVVPLGDELTKVKSKYLHIMEVVVSRLKRYGVLYNKDATSLSKFLILKAREAFRQNPPERLPRNQYGIVEGDFALAMSLYHGYELLQLHGSRSLYNFLDGILTGEKGYGRTRTELTRNADFNELMGLLSGKYTKPESETPSQAQAKPFVIGHPKMEKLQEIVLDHFNTHSDATTRVMIFSQYRDSVQEITDMLHVHQPVVKVMSFIGQATAGKSTKGFTQKEQLKVMKQFREGGYNTLVSTCVGEEGLDIGDVDLIICFDAHKSPIRLVQRMGRTGRKREGRIVMLVTQGKEEQIYNQSQYSKKSIHKAILNGAKSLHFYQHSPRMLPDNFTPTCHKMHITVKENFKPTKKITADKDANQSKITSMLSDATSKKECSADVITLEEYQELEAWLVPEDDVPKLPPNKIMCLSSEDTEECQEEEGKYLSLSEWSPWQNTLQETVYLDHSLGSKHLVQLMEFVQLQQSMDPSVDAYGLEMASYLNEEDILKPGETDGPSLLRFLVPKQNNNQENLMKKGTRKGGKSKSRRSDNLPKFDFLKDNIEEDSDGELPAFDISVGANKETSKIKKTSGIIHRKHSDDSNQLETLCENDVDDFPEVVNLSDEVRNIASGIDKGKKESLNQTDSVKPKKQFVSKAKALEKRMSISKNRKRKTRHSSGQTSIIKLIADNDLNDFDGPIEVSVVENEEQDDISDVPENPDSPKTAYSEEENNRKNTGNESCDSEVTNEAEEDKSKLYFRIGTPPPIEDIEELCKTIEKAGNFGNIDLCSVTDKWHLENKTGKYIVYPESMNESFDGELDTNETAWRNTPADLAERNGKGLSPFEKAKTNNKEIKRISDRGCETSVDIELTEESLENELMLGNQNNSRERVGSSENIEMNKSYDSHNSNTEKRSKSFRSSLETVIHSQIKSVEDQLINDNITVNTEQTENDEIACTGNFMLTADDILSTSEDLLDKEMNEYLLNSKEKSPQKSAMSKKYIDRNKVTFDYNIQCNNRQSHKDSQRRRHDSSFEHDVTYDLGVTEKKSDTGTNGSIVDIGLLENLNSSNESIATGRLQVPFSSGKETNFDSFFADDKDDDILIKVKTPLDCKAYETGTQITFTQALNFVHSGTKASGSESGSESHVKDAGIPPPHINGTAEMSSPKFCSSIKNSKKGCRTKYNDDESFLHCDTSYSQSNLMEPDNKKISEEESFSRKASTSSEDGVEMPEFDLGFDFDEDIIPPSPTSTQTSQRSASSRLSQTFAFTHRLGQSRRVSDEMTDDYRPQLWDKSTDDKSIDQGKKSKSDLKKEAPNKCSVFTKPYQEESQSLFEDGTSAGLRDRKSSAKVLFGKSTLGAISEITEDYFLEAESESLRNDDHENDDSDRLIKEKEGKNDDKRVGSLTATDLNADFEQAFNGSCEINTSFALLGEDLDDWIDSGVEPKVMYTKKDIPKEKESFKEKHGCESLKPLQKSVLAPDIRKNTPVATVSPVLCLQGSNYKPLNSFSQSYSSVRGKHKRIRKSTFFMEDIPSDFDDSFNVTNDVVVDKHTPKNNGKTGFRAHNTSTPVDNTNGQQVTTSLLTESMPNITTSKAECGTEDTPLKATNHSSVNVTDRSPVSVIYQHHDPFEDDEMGIQDNDDSFIVRRKKKVQILDSPLTQKKGTDMSVTDCVGNEDSREKKEGNTVFLSSSDNDDFDDSVLLSKNKYIVQKTKPLEIDHSSDEDFVETAVQSDKQITSMKAKKKSETLKEDPAKVKNKKILKHGRKNKRSSNPFIEDEAELSEEDDSAASSDEHEGSDLDVYEGSFIANSQFTESQALDQTDIHALYLKSVKSPVTNRGGFKLQFNQRNNIDVYSQRPPQEESQYMEDSFCVGSEEDDDWLRGEEDSDTEEEPREVTMMQNSVIQTGRKRRRGIQAFQTSRQREIQVGRMKALNEIRSKLAYKGANRHQQKQFKNLSSNEDHSLKPIGTKRSRIRVLDESSSDEENKFPQNTSDLISPKAQPIRNTNKRPRRVLSSDESESEELNEERSICRSNKSIHMMDRNVDMITDNSSANKQSTDTLRQERLQKQKEKQAEFKRLMEEKQNTGNAKFNDDKSVSVSVGLTRIKEKSEITRINLSDGFEFAKPTSDCKGDNTDLLLPSAGKSKFSDKPVILVDSKEISGSQDIISDLRFKHDILVSAAQLPGCDYIVSNRMAVERKQWSEFSNGANRAKLIERMQHLGELYDRPCLIVEKDRVKPGEEKSTRPVHWTKYVDRTLALLQRSDVKVLFTDNYTETAEVLADLCRLEQRKNMAINVPVDLNDEQLYRVKFFVSFPKLSYIHALNLCNGFRSVSEFLKSSIASLESLGKMSRNRATEVHSYIRRKFDPNMLPSCYK